MASELAGNSPPQWTSRISRLPRWGAWTGVDEQMPLPIPAIRHLHHRRDNVEPRSLTSTLQVPALIPRKWRTRDRRYDHYHHRCERKLLGLKGQQTYWQSAVGCHWRRRLPRRGGHMSHEVWLSRLRVSASRRTEDVQDPLNNLRIKNYPHRSRIGPSCKSIILCYRSRTRTACLLQVTSKTTVIGRRLPVLGVGVWQHWKWKSWSQRKESRARSDDGNEAQRPCLVKCLAPFYLRRHYNSLCRSDLPRQCDFIIHALYCSNGRGVS